MGKRIQYCEVKCSCEQSDYDVVAICREANVEDIKARCMKSMVDFIKPEEMTVTLKLEVSNTDKLPEEGVDILIRKKDFVKPEEQQADEPKKEVEIIDGASIKNFRNDF